MILIPKLLRETSAALEYGATQQGVPWPWNVPDGEWTYELFRQLPEDGNRYEVIGGKLIVSPSPVVSHQRVVHKLGYFLEDWVRKTGSGEVFPGPLDVILSTATPKQGYAEPDLLFVAKERLCVITSKNVQGAPDLVVEILSPSTARYDWLEKKTAYAAAGVTHYWVVDPDHKVLTAFRLQAGQYAFADRYESEAVFEPAGFPGLRINLAEVWGKV